MYINGNQNCGKEADTPLPSPSFTFTTFIITNSPPQFSLVLPACFSNTNNIIEYQLPRNSKVFYTFYPLVTTQI